MEVLSNNNGDLVVEDIGAAYDEDEDEGGFIKVMEQYILQICPRTGAKILQQRAMVNYKLKFKRETGVLAAHMTHSLLPKQKLFTTFSFSYWAFWNKIKKILPPLMPL